MNKTLTQASLLAAVFASALLAVPFMVSAQGLIDGDTGGFGTLITALVNLINNFLIPLAIAAAVLVFIYGVFQYFILGGADEDKRAQGRSLMLYAIIGFVAIVALFAIVDFFAGSLGLDTGTGIDSLGGGARGPDVGGAGGG